MLPQRRACSGFTKGTKSRMLIFRHVDLLDPGGHRSIVLDGTLSYAPQK